MKVSLGSLKRTNFAFPSEWEGQTVDKQAVKISYRCGEIKIYVAEKLVETTEKNELDVGGYMEDEELEKVLLDQELAAD